MHRDRAHQAVAARTEVGAEPARGGAGGLVEGGRGWQCTYGSVDERDCCRSLREELGLFCMMVMAWSSGVMGREREGFVYVLLALFGGWASV